MKKAASKLISLFRNIKVSKRNIIIIMLLIIASLASFYLVSNNENFYNKTIAKITSISEQQSAIKDMNEKVEQIKKQKIKAVIMNGRYIGKEINLENTASFSQVSDLDLKVNDEVFVSIQINSSKQITTSTILDLKRDKYIVYIAILFTLLILLIGGLKGLRSLMSVIINILIFSIIVQVFLHGYNLILISVIASILFIILSISIVTGVNRKALSAILGTMAGTLISMIIAVIVIQLNHWNGIHFEEMEFLTRPPEPIFIFEILVGTLGAIMDIAISISASIKEIHDKNPNIDRKVLVKSGMEIGKDIMGTMANTLVFAYVSGSIPIILLLLRNGFPISVIISFNLSLEIIRVLTGSMGIVLSIPITIYISVLLFKNQKIGEF